MDSSAASITQEKRFLWLHTPIGSHVLLVEHCVGLETLSGLLFRTGKHPEGLQGRDFLLELDLVLDLQKHRTSEVKPEDLLGRKVALAVKLKHGERYFNGIVKSFTQGHRDDRFQYYRMEVVPWTWLLTLKSNCRIFQNHSAPEIVKMVFDKLKGDYGDLVSYREALSKQYVQRDYCVQYRETDFNFISRLLEHEGIFYFFEHSESSHTLVLTDTNSTFKPVPDNSGRFRYCPEGGYEERLDTVISINRKYKLLSGKTELRDYHFEMPAKNLEKTETTTIQVADNPKLALYDYPGDYALIFNKPGMRLGDVEPTGEKFVRVHMQEVEAGHLVLTGASSARAFTPGQQFELTEHRDMAGKYALIQVEHVMSQVPSYVSGQSAKTPYQNSFVCIPNSVPYRPYRLTPKPVVQGPQTAVVTVKSGEESWLDKYGRVRIQFHWDRLGKNDEESTCWVRVAQPWAGSGWGAHYWPRIGQEVVIEFLEGDPDQPLVTGSVYNASQMPPYELPKYYTRSGVKTRSSKQGSSSNYNELRMEDKKGDEQVFFQAEKDMDVRVKHDSREYIGNDRSLIVKQDQKESVEGNKHLYVKSDHAEKIDGQMSHQVGTERDEKVGTVYTVESGEEIHLKAGMKVIIEAGVQLTIIGAGGFVDIGPAGVTIQGIMVNINSGGSPGTGTPASPKDPVNPDTADDGSKGTKL